MEWNIPDGANYELAYYADEKLQKLKGRYAASISTDA